MELLLLYLAWSNNVIWKLDLFSNEGIMFSIVQVLLDLTGWYFQYQQTDSDDGNYRSVSCQTHYDVANENNNVYQTS